MYHVYAFATPNSIRVPIMLEELGLPYELHAVNVRKGEQNSDAFLALNPNGKVPVLHNPDTNFTLTESAAIVTYLADSHQKFLPAGGEERARVFEQLFFQASGIGPAFGQSGYFQRSASEQLPLAIARFHTEAKRTLHVLDGILSKRPYTAGDAYTIADIVHFGWLWRRAFAGVDFSTTPHVEAWYERVLSRPAVKRAIERVEALVPSA